MFASFRGGGNMIDYKESFARMEKKYILDRNTMSLFLNAAGKRIDEDDYPHSVINSIYFDSFESRAGLFG